MHVESSFHLMFRLSMICSRLWQLISPRGNTKCLSRMGKERMQLLALEICQDVPVNTLIYVENGISSFMATSSQGHVKFKTKSSSIGVSIYQCSPCCGGLIGWVQVRKRVPSNTTTKIRFTVCWVTFLCILLWCSAPVSI